MTSTSSLTRSLPASRRTPTLRSTAVNFLLTVKDRNAGRIDALPIAGCRSGKFHKLDPFNERALNVHDVVTIIASSSNTDAVAYLAAIAEDAGKADTICVKLSTVEVPPSLDAAELALVGIEARFTTLLDLVRQRSPIERTTLHDTEIRVEVAARAAVIAAEVHA